MTDAASPWRTLRWWVTTGLVVVGIAACLGLGAWQFDRARTRDTPTGPANPMAAAPVDLAAVLPADGRVLPGARPVAVRVGGSFDRDHELQVPGRVLDGADVAYVVTPLVMSDGRGVLVVRGAAPASGLGPVHVPPPPAGEVTVTGWLAPSEQLDAGTVDPVALQPGQVATVTAARALSLVPYPLVDGYVGMVAQDPSGSALPAGLTPLPVPLVEPGVRWSVQSLSYALEWWFFALAGVWMWLQALRIERQRLAEDAAGGPGGQPPVDVSSAGVVPPGG